LTGFIWFMRPSLRAIPLEGRALLSPSNAANIK
jgi:hypothetical protein